MRSFLYPCAPADRIQKYMSLFERESYPVGEKLGEQGLYLPSGSGLTEEIKYTCHAICEINDNRS